MTGVLCLVFAVSGAAALLFEVLWFRQAGLVLGNTVWAASLVTAGFMAGLALGNGLAIRLGSRLARPLRVYAGLEIVIAAAGVALVFGLPILSTRSAGWWAGLGPGFGLNLARLGSAFVLLVLPSAAMGATLPLLARSLSALDANFGRVLGRLYGWNTLGAVGGALAGEVFLIEWFGVMGTAAVAAGLNGMAAAGALILNRRMPALPIRAQDPSVPGEGGGWRAPAAAFLAGFLLLGLEVVWFRFLQLFIAATSLTFAVMLAVVLLGIACGSLAAAFWLSRRPDYYRAAPLIALAAAAATTASYAAFPGILAARGNEIIYDLPGVTLQCARLMLPVCVLSGALFTLLGKAVQARGLEESRAAGILTLANTIGAMLGALAAGFLLLPFLGIERALFLFSAAYLVVAAIAPGGWPPRVTPVRALAWGLALLMVALFPFGLMRGRFLRLIAERWLEGGSRLVAVEEGLTETVLLFRHDSLGQPLTWRLVTNGLGMSGTNYVAHRYMGLFVWLPVALHPAPRSALVISYGLGTTARALTDTRELSRIDVVDVSADVLRLSAGVWPEPEADPLRDPRVHVHVEDGRFFLLTTRQRYDLITGEPPPPKTAGISSLYSREYFRLVRERLNEGGMATYWLPVYQFEAPEAFSVVRGFCDAFPDCSLWTGIGGEWILMGTRNARGPVSEERFTSQWRDPVVAARLKEAGLESPEQMGALFLADAESLAGRLADIPPLVDDRPHRLNPRTLAPPRSPLYFEMMETEPARQRFRASRLITQLWPAALREASLTAFPAQRLVNRMGWVQQGAMPGLPALEEVLTRSSLQTVALWHLGTSSEEQDIAARLASAGVQNPELAELQGLGALARRDYRAAEAFLAHAEPHAAHAARLRQWRILAASLAGERDRAAHLLAEARPLIKHPAADPADWSWLARRIGSSAP